MSYKVKRYEFQGSTSGFDRKLVGASLKGSSSFLVPEVVEVRKWGVDVDRLFVCGTRYGIVTLRNFFDK